MNRFITLGILVLFSIIGTAQNTHILTGNDTYFAPDTLYIEAGDTVNFISNGYHSATEVDSLDWVNNTANHNGGFYVGFGAPTSSMKFTIDNEGTYYNICVPHAGMGMKSIIIVTAALEIEDTERNNETIIYPNPSNHSISVHNSNSIEIFNLAGQLVLNKTNLSLSEQIDISELPKGQYVVVLDSGKQKLVVE